MAVDNPVNVKKKKIDSVDQVGWPLGLDLNEVQNVDPRSFTAPTKDVRMDVNGFLTPRETLVPFLPDTVETTYQKFPVEWDNKTYFFTLDENKAKFCLESDTSWTDCGGTNSLTTNNGGKPKFLRVLDGVFILNGKNGDKLAYIDLTTTGFPVVKYTAVSDPSSAPTSTLTNLTATGSFMVYYAYSYSGVIGETNLSPILSQQVNIVRDKWASATSPGSIKLTRPDFGSEPTGAQFWNVYIALAATAGTIQVTDMLPIALKLDLAVDSFVDDGTLDINLGGTAPTANSTDGFKVNHGIVEDGNPILFDDEDNKDAIHIGGGGPYARDFSTSNGGYLSEPEKGTNYKPKVIVGYRTGQGQPALTVLFSNSEGLAKQSVLEQKTVNYGNQSFNVWGVTEQHYGAAGVAATDSAVNYNGKLLFVSTDGLMGMDTEAAKQNVLSTKSLTALRLDKYMRGVKISAMGNIIGIGWDNRFMWTMPNDGFDTPQQILVSDDNVGGSFYTMDIPADWIGVVSPVDRPAFIYISKGNKTYKLSEADATYDIKNGVPIPFSTKVTGALSGVAGKVHNRYQANVQAVFNLLGIVGTVTVGVTYRNQQGKLKTKKKVYNGPSYIPSAAGGWGDPGWTYGEFPQVTGWGSAPPISESARGVSSVDKRVKVFIGEVFSEAQWFVSTDVGYNMWKLREINFEGINLGVLPDL